MDETRRASLRLRSARNRQIRDARVRHWLAVTLWRERKDLNAYRRQAARQPEYQGLVLYEQGRQDGARAMAATLAFWG